MSKPVINTQSGMAVWPEDWPLRFQTNEPCDMAVGPCACGAWHQAGDFELRDGVLYDNGKPDTRARSKRTDTVQSPTPSRAGRE